MENIVHDFATSCSEQSTIKNSSHHIEWDWNYKLQFGYDLIHIDLPKEKIDSSASTTNFRKVYILCCIKITLFPIYFRVLTDSAALVR